MPENANHIVRLEAFAHSIASTKYQGDSPKISKNRLRTICNTGVLGKGYFSLMEDRNTNLFTESFTFFGGGYTVFNGIAEEATFILDHLSKAIFNTSPRFPNSEFTKAAHDVLLLILKLSNEIAERLSIERGVTPLDTNLNGVLIPQSQRLERLKQAVIFTREDIKALLSSRGISSSTLEALAIDAGEVDLSSYSPENGQLLAKPLVKINSDIIIPIPGTLVSAARNEIIQLAQDYKAIDPLIALNNSHIWNTINESLSYLDIKRVPLKLPKGLTVPNFKEGIFSFDVDKVVYASLTTDLLDDYDSQSVFGAGKPLEIAPVIARFQQIKEYLWRLPEAPNSILFLLIFQGVGRGSAIGFDLDDEKGAVECLALSAAELETIALHEGGKPLLLWKYARASRKIRDEIRVLSHGALNEFELYRSRGYSYYISDDARPQILMVDPGTDRELHKGVQEKIDRHAVPAYRSNYFIEVVNLHGLSKYPIYVPLNDRENRVSLLVEGLPLPVWIVSPDFENDEWSRNNRRLYLELADTIGYWLWQFTPLLDSVLAAVQSEFSRILIRLKLVPSDFWLIGEEDPRSTEEPILFRSRQSDGTIFLTLTPTISSLLSFADNRGERLLVRSIFEGLRELLPKSSQSLLSDHAISTAIERYAPLGIKKRMFLLDARKALEADARGLPKYRGIQEIDEDEILDKLGDYLISERGYQIGAVPKELRGEVLKDAVAFLFKEFTELAQMLSSNSLLEILIGRQEAVVQESAHYQLTIATRLACFSSVPEMVEELARRTPKYTKASIASRFVVEYFAAQPPSGLRPLSTSIYDRLQALAAHIVNFGHSSDLIYFGISDTEVKILPSQRLAIVQDDFRAARERFSEIHSWTEVRLSPSRLKDIFESEQEKGDKPELIEQIDEALSVELGHSLTELVTLIPDTVNLHDHSQAPVACFAFDDLVTKLSASLGWSTSKVEDAVNLLSLKPRKDFLRAPEPYGSEDVWPWRFNRALSYLRRPLVHREQNGEIEILWGNRNTYQAGKYLTELVLDGRLKTSNKKVKTVFGELHRLQGETFNDVVADVYEAIPHFVVRRRVKKVGRFHITGERGDLGDLDVLVADLKKRRISVVECKDIKMSGTPYELWGEITNLITGKNPVVVRHQKRTIWVKNHIKEVLKFLEIDSNKKWKVEPLIVVSRELMGPFLKKTNMPIISIEQVKDLLER